MSQHLRLVVSAGAVLLAGCSAEPLNPDRCNVRLAVISPDPATLEIGQAVTLQAQLTEASTCLPADAQSANLRWMSANPGIGPSTRSAAG